MQMNKYSVLMSVYKKENANYLSQAINSMLNQTVKPTEIVLVEDGPLTDELYEVIDFFVRENPSVFKIVKNEQNLGLGLALAKGLLECSNELVARMDTDDIAKSDRIQKELAEFDEDSKLSLCGGYIREFEGEDIDYTVGIRTVPIEDTEIKTYIKSRCPFNHMTVMFKKSEVLKAGNYQHLLYNEDYLLWINMLKAGCKFKNIPEVLVDVRVDKNFYSDRRGGNQYFESEKAIQDILLKNKMIDKMTYSKNITIRFILEKMMTPNMRSFMFKHFARKRG